MIASQKFVKWFLINRFGEFHRIYKLGASGDRDEWIRLWGQQQRLVTKYGEKSTFGAILSAQNIMWCLFEMHLTLGMLLHYCGKLEIQFSADIQQIWNKMQTNCILSAPILSPLHNVM